MPKLKGKQPGFQMGAEHRGKIANSLILSNLIRHCLGEWDMSQTQVTASLGLLKKVMPDVSQVDINALMTHDLTDPMIKIYAEIAANGKRIGKD